jgi:hypothetical protein
MKTLIPQNLLHELDPVLALLKSYNYRVFISGGTLTIGCLNYFCNREIPDSHIEDLDIFVIGGYTQSFYKALNDIGLYEDKYNNSYRYASTFANYKTRDHKINVLLYESKYDEEGILNRFDLFCNQIGYNVTNECFHFSNQFINFLDTDDLLVHKWHDNRTFARMFYKQAQYKLKPNCMDPYLLSFITPGYFTLNYNNKSNEWLKASAILSINTWVQDKPYVSVEKSSTNMVLVFDEDKFPEDLHVPKRTVTFDEAGSSEDLYRSKRTVIFYREPSLDL